MFSCSVEAESVFKKIRMFFFSGLGEEMEKVSRDLLASLKLDLEDEKRNPTSKPINPCACSKSERTGAGPDYSKTCDQLA